MENNINIENNAVPQPEKKVSQLQKIINFMYAEDNMTVKAIVNGTGLKESSVRAIISMNKNKFVKLDKNTYKLASQHTPKEEHD